MDKIISNEQARLLYLKNQLLLNAKLREGKNGVLDVIEHLGYVQIDTISVVARAHHHVLWSRIKNYEENFLSQLLETDKTIFEYWSHAASYLPMKDFRFSLPRKKIFAKGKSHWFEKDKQIMKYVLDRIKNEGELQSKDFEDNTKRAGMWNWKPAKRALEQLFMEGKLMVAKRVGFQKVYDLTERVLPKGIETSTPSDKEYAKFLINKCTQTFGLVSEHEVSYLRHGLRPLIVKTIKEMLENEELIKIEIEGNSSIKYITTETQINSIKNIKQKNKIHLLSPFDNAVIQRKRLLSQFNFDYSIECYVPEEKRIFGYYSLPILYNAIFVGRIDCKADRGNKKFHVNSIHFEKFFIPDFDFKILLAEKLKLYAKFCGCMYEEDDKPKIK